MPVKPISSDLANWTIDTGVHNDPFIQHIGCGVSPSTSLRIALFKSEMGKYDNVCSYCESPIPQCMIDACILYPGGRRDDKL